VTLFFVTGRFLLIRSAIAAQWFAVGLLLALRPTAAGAQPVDFGSSDDPREELQVVWWRYQSSLDVSGGLSLISDHWRGGANVRAGIVSRSLTARLSGTLRGGIYGRYEPDSDETYDLLRMLEFVRYNPPARSRFYARAGFIERMRLGTGHLVNFFNSQVAWNDRTVGAEFMQATPLFDVAAFTDNVLVNGVVGGRAAIRPLYWADHLRTQSLEIGLNYVTDLHTRTSDWQGVTGYNLDVSFNALASGEIRLVPFVSFARYPEYGSGISFGANVESDNFIDLARFRLRTALYYNGRQFIPGYVGAFYHVSNPRERILNAEDYLEGTRTVDFEGIELQSALGGNDFETELRLLIFEKFELWYYFRRHYGTHSLSEYHLRLFYHRPNQLRINIGMDRGGLKGFFSLFNDLGDQTALVFGTDYRVVGPFWVFLHSRYTFDYAGLAEDGTRMFLVERRFEPFTGIRFDF
jgi:hypothetical protein